MAPVLSIRGLSKSFGSTQALSGVDFSVDPGEVHALVGENGSGKSTLIKILAGYHEPDPGYEATFNGEPLTLGDPAAAARANIRFVHQDLGLVDTLSSVENVALGSGYDTRHGRIAWRQETRAVQEAIERLGYDFDVRRPVSELAPSERVGVAIARALRGWHHDGGQGMLVLDEPTASLPAPEVSRLFEVVRSIRDGGTPVVYVSHRFEEIFQLADRVTVLRDGKLVANRDVEGLDHDGLVELLLGRELARREPMGSVTREGEVVLQVSSLRGRVLDGIDLELRAGEVVGVAGVTGSGREEVAPLLFGAEPMESGVVRIGSTELSNHTPADAIKHGLAMVPAERRRFAIFVETAVRENLTMVDLTSCRRRWAISRRKERAEVQEWITRLSIHPGDQEAAIGTLSGGNQQKVVVAKWLRLGPRVLLLDEPTQGVDVGSKADIHGHLRAAADSGTAVLVCSTDLEELVQLCDRVIVLVGGRISTELSGAELNDDDLGEAILAPAEPRGALV